MLKDKSNDFLDGESLTEDTIFDSILDVGLEETLKRASQGYDRTAEDFERNAPSDRMFGVLYALHKFLERHGVKHEWKYEG